MPKTRTPRKNIRESLFPYSGSKHREAPAIKAALDKLLPNPACIYEGFAGSAALSAYYVAQGYTGRVVLEDLDTSPALAILTRANRQAAKDAGFSSTESADRFVEVLQELIRRWNEERAAIPRADYRANNVRETDWLLPKLEELDAAHFLYPMSRFFRYCVGGVYVGVQSSGVLYRQHQIKSSEEQFRRWLTADFVAIPCSESDYLPLPEKSIIYFDPPYEGTAPVYHGLQNDVKTSAVDRMLWQKTVKLAPEADSFVAFSYGDGMLQYLPPGVEPIAVRQARVSRIRSGEQAANATRTEWLAVMPWEVWRKHYIDDKQQAGA